MGTDALSAWLELHCRKFPEVRHAAITAMDDTENHAIVASWPNSNAALSETFTAAEKQCQSSQKSVIRLLGSSRDSVNSAVIATPLDAAGLPTHTALFECTIDSETESRELLQHLRDSQDSLANTTPQQALKHTVSAEGLLELVATLIANDDFQTAARAFCEDLASAFNANSVLLSSHQKQHHRVVALSGQSNTSQQGAYLRKILELINESTDFSQVTVAPALSPGINALHSQYHKSTGLSVITLPLLHNNEIFGALHLQRKQAWTQNDESSLTLLSTFLAPLLVLQQAANASILQRLTLKLKQATAHKRSQWISAISLFLIGLLVTASLQPVPLKLATAATLEASTQRIITAPERGFIGSVNVRPGDHVEQGELLLQFEDRELKLEQSQLSSQLAKQQTNYSAALAQQKRTEMMSAQADIREIKARLALIDNQIHRTQIKAPFSGYVMDGDLSQQLGAAIAQGDTLLVLAPEEDFRVRLEVSEQDITLVQAQQMGSLQLTALPEQKYIINIERINPLANTTETNNVFIVEAKLQDPSSDLRPGMSGQAYIHAGTVSWLTRQTRRLRNWLYIQQWKWLA